MSCVYRVDCRDCDGQTTEPDVSLDGDGDLIVIAAPCEICLDKAEVKGHGSRDDEVFDLTEKVKELEQEVGNLEAEIESLKDQLQ